MRIIDLQKNREKYLLPTAQLLLAALPSGWATMEEAIEEVEESLEPNRISRIALDEIDQVLGWIGGMSDYGGNVWELHPLVVWPEKQGQGIGRMLVQDFEEQVKKRGGLTIYLGTDDENHQTSLGGQDLYIDLFSQLTKLKNVDRHPFEFYKKLGYQIVGVLPDANGFGKPDIFMAKRVIDDTLQLKEAE